MTNPSKWRRSIWRGLVLRVQASSLIRPALRRAMLNSIGARIDRTAIISHSCWLGSADIVMASNTMLNAFAYYDGEATLILLHGARVAVRSTFITASHAITTNRFRRSSATAHIEDSIVLEEGVWIGAGTTVLPGVTIAQGCVVAAGSVVIADTRPNGMYANAAGPSGAVRAQRIKDLPTSPIGL